jgi:3-oxoacyl-[acyl-carrier protein] reductase
LIIKDSVILVTGGANGLGLSLSCYLFNLGAKVVVVDIDSNAFDNLPMEVGCYETDVTDPSQVQSTVKKIIKKYHQIDALINNAGNIFSKPLINIMDPNEMKHDFLSFRNSIKVNLDSVFITSSVVAEHMVQSRRNGNIINISSISAYGNEGQTAYSAAKGGVNSMTVTWSKELARFGIRCNAVAPGFLNTNSTNSVLNESQLRHIKSNTPLKRLGEADEVSKAVTSILENDFLNGVILDVNGGLTI